MNSESGISRAVLRTLKRVALNKTWRRIYDEARTRTDFCQALMEGLDISLRFPKADLERIPAKGPVIIVANHPTGFLDGIALGAVVPNLRPDIRLLANSLLECFPEMVPITFFVDPFGGPEAAKHNVASLRA